MKIKIVKVVDRALQHGFYLDFYDDNDEKIGNDSYMIWVPQDRKMTESDVINRIIKRIKEKIADGYLSNYQDFSNLEGREIQL